MLKPAEREALTKFISHHPGEFAAACDYCDVSKFLVAAKLQGKGRKLTERETVAAKAFLRRLNKEFKSWCDIYEVSPDSIRTNIDKAKY